MEDEWMCETVETILSLSLSLRYFKDACSRRIIVVSCAHHDINTFDHSSFPFFDDFMQISRYPRHTPASNLKLTWKLRGKEWQGFRTIFWKLSWTLIERCWLVLSDGDERQDDFRSFIGYVGKFNETIFNEYGLNSKWTITPDYFVVIVRIFLLFFFSFSFTKNLPLESSIFIEFIRSNRFKDEIFVSSRNRDSHQRSFSGRHYNSVSSSS